MQNAGEKETVSYVGEHYEKEPSMIIEQRDVSCSGGQGKPFCEKDMKGE